MSDRKPQTPEADIIERLHEITEEVQRLRRELKSSLGSRRRELSAEREAIHNSTAKRVAEKAADRSRKKR
jgi:hypothetical protein